MVLIIIQARLGSTRLPGKVLRKAGGRELLDIQVERVKKTNCHDKIVIATSTLETDNPIEDFCIARGIECFRGDEQDVLLRYYECAKNYKADTIIRLTADCPLICSQTIDQVHALHKEESSDYTANTVPWNKSTFPNGSDVEIFSFKTLERTHELATKQQDREHVTFYMWQNQDLFKTRQLKRNENLSNFRYTVDYPQDLQVVDFVVKKLEAEGLEGTVKEITDLIDSSEEIRKINEGISFEAGWGSSS